MEMEIRKLLNQVNGRPVRVTSLQFAQLWSPPLHHTRAVLRMRDLVLSPPAGFIVEEREGRRIVLEIRRTSDASH